jgi:glycosyltransferase involved in cell wall biosynthesis
MKALVISSKYHPEYSGPGHRAHGTYKRLKDKYGVECDVLANSVEYNDNSVYEYDGVKIVRVARRLGALPSGGFLYKAVNHFIYLLNYLYQGYETIKVLRRGSYDLVHTFGSSISVNVGALYAMRRKVPLLREVCNNGTRPEPLLPLKLNGVSRQRFGPRARVVAVSRRIGDFCRGAGLPEDRLWERPNPVDEARFYPGVEEKAGLRRRLTRFGPDDIVLAYVAKFSPGKNQVFLADVMKSLDRRYKLLLVGPVVAGGRFYERDREYFLSLLRSLDEEGLRDRVKLVKGYVINPQDYIRLSDVYVFPTLFEALGTPMLESIACGVPVVANRIEGVTDYWIKEGRNGFLCELRPEEFARCVERAAAIAPPVLEAEAREVLTKASSSVIDKEYYEIMRQLIMA